MLRDRKGRAAGFVLIALVAIVGVTSLGAGGAGARQTSLLASLPRDQTLYMSGNQWSPNTDLNPAKNWDYVTGLVGLVYETPFRYDPLKDKFIPWLATSGKWSSPSTYKMTVRKGVTWSDGQAMTPADVKYSFDLAKNATHPQHPLWADTGLMSTKVSGNDVVFSFSKTPGYQQFDFYRYNVAIVPQHIYKSYKAATYYFRLKAYDSAILYLKDLVATYPKTAVVPDALVKLVQAYKTLGYREDVQETCDYIRRFHPKAPRAGEVCPRKPAGA